MLEGHVPGKRSGQVRGRAGRRNFSLKATSLETAEVSFVL